MRNALWLLVIAAAASVAALAMPGKAEGSAGKPSKKAVGTYLIQFTVDGLTGVSFQGMASVHADGSVNGSDTNDFGFGGGGRDSIQFGTFVQTGKTTGTARTIFMTYDASGNHVTTAVNTFLISTADNFETVSYTFSSDFFAPTDDPLDPESTPVASRTGVGSGRKLYAE